MAKRTTDIDEKLFYDFEREKWWFTFIFGYAEPKGILYKIYMGVMYSFFIFIYTMTAYGIYNVRDHAEIFFLTIHVLMNATFFVWGLTTRLFVGNAIKNVRNSILNGIYKYEDEPLDDDEIKILREGIEKIRISCSLLLVACVTGGLSNLVYFPVSQYIRVGQEEYEEQVDIANPYYPHSFHTPFSTRSTRGFMIGFALNIVFQLYIYGIAVAMNEIYVGAWVQFTTQLQILNHSIKNVQSRAFRMYLTELDLPPSESFNENLYAEPFFQKCLYKCLVSNVKHFWTLLRFKKQLLPFCGSCLLLIVTIASMTFATLLALIMMKPPMNLMIHYIILLVAENSYTFYLCFFGQEVTDESCILFESIYAVPWYNCNRRFNRILLIFMTMAKQPIKVRALLLNIDASIETYGMFMSAMYKIVSVLTQYKA